MREKFLQIPREVEIPENRIIVKHNLYVLQIIASFKRTQPRDIIVNHNAHPVFEKSHFPPIDYYETSRFCV